MDLNSYTLRVLKYFISPVLVDLARKFRVLERRIQPILQLKIGVQRFSYYYC